MDGVVREGDVLAGKYRVERILRQGGMGIVVAAEHLQLRLRVALKLLLPSACAAPEAVNRFLREARAASQIQSEHVVRVTDAGTLESGMPYMVMEFLRGADLLEVIQTQGPILIGDAIDWVLQACEPLAEAHKLGIVHRDLKPSNLFVTRRADGSPLIKVLDFGISKAMGLEGALSVNTTASTAFLGSPAYMSPEQIRSAKHVDERTDIWALGVVLHELLTGRPVYQADTVSALMAMVLTDPPTPVRQIRPDVPAGLEQVILRCLEKDRTRRYASVGELATALSPFRAGNGQASRRAVGRAWSRRDKALAAAAAIGGLALAATVAGLWADRSPPTVVAAAIFGSVTLAAIVVGLVFRRAKPWPEERGPRWAAASPAPWAAEVASGELSPSPSPSPAAWSSPAVAEPWAEQTAPAEAALDGYLFRFLPHAPVMAKEERVRLLGLGLELSRQPALKVTIVGYGDKAGTDPVTVGLAKYRAKVGQVLLARVGVIETRVTVTFGDASDARLARSIRVTTAEPVAQR
jgi:serine/threonine-protein kinase